MLDLKKGQEIELQIDDLAYGGKGLSRLNNFVIFVEKAIPGQKVLAYITKKKKENVSEIDIDEKKESQDSLLDDIQMKEKSKPSKLQDNLLDDIQVQKKKKELLEEINDEDFAKNNESSLDALAMLDEDEQIKLKEVEPLDILDKYEKKNQLDIEDNNNSNDNINNNNNNNSNTNTKMI